VEEYIHLMKSVPVFRRRVIRESGSFKIYLPQDYAEIWNYLSASGKKIDVVIFLPKKIMMVDRIILRNHKIVREYNRYKIYLNRKYEKIWAKIIEDGEKIDAVVLIK